VRTGNVLNVALLARFEAVWFEVEQHFATGARIVEIR